MPKANKPTRKLVVSIDSVFQVKDCYDLIDLDADNEEETSDIRPLDELHYLDSEAVLEIARNDFIVPFRTLMRAYEQANSHPETPYEEIFNEHGKSKKVSLFVANDLFSYSKNMFKVLYEARPTSKPKEVSLRRKRVSVLNLYFNEGMTLHLRHSSAFLLYCDTDSKESFDNCMILYRLILPFTSSKKRLIVCCPIEEGETALQALLRHLRKFHNCGMLVESTVTPHVEFHAIRISDEIDSIPFSSRQQRCVSMCLSCLRCGLRG